MAEDNGRQHSFIAGRRLRRRQARLRQGPLRPPPSPGSATVWTKRGAAPPSSPAAPPYSPVAATARTPRGPSHLGTGLRRPGQLAAAAPSAAELEPVRPEEVVRDEDNVENQRRAENGEEAGARSSCWLLPTSC
jgi:hypothetical protein